MAANGQIDRGTDDPNDRREDGQQKTVAQPAQHRSIEVTVQAGDGVVGANVNGFDGNRGTARGRTGVYGRNSGFATDDNRHPDYYSTGAIAARRAQAKAERDVKQARFNAVADRMNAATARRDAKEASTRAERRAAEAAKYTIDAGAWGEMGKRNGQIREERTELKNDDGSLRLDENGEPQVEVKKFRNEGSMLDAEANKDAIAGVNKWWQEYGQYDQRLGAAKGAFNEKGELDASKLTADQFAELQRVKGNFDAKQKPIQDRIKFHEAENAMRDSDYLYSKGVKVWDTQTGKRNYTPEQAREMARRMRTQEAYGELGRLADPTQFQEGGRYSNKRGGVEGQRDAAVAELLGDRVAAIINGTGEDRRAADEAAMMRRMRDLGFAADQIADKNGNIDLGRIEAALRGTPAVQEQLRAKQGAARPLARETPVDGVQTSLNADLLKDIPQVEVPAQPKPGWMAETTGGPRSPEDVEVTLPGDDVAAAPAERLVTPAWDPETAIANFRRVNNIPEPAKPFSPSDLLGIRSLPADDGRPALAAARTPVAGPNRGTIRAAGRAPVDPMVAAFQSRGLNPLGTATQIAGAVPAGIVQMAGGATRMARGDTVSGAKDVALGMLGVAGGRVATTKTMATPRGGSLPANRFSGGAMPGSGSVRAVQRRLEARAGAGEGVINPKAVSRPLGKEASARVEANYRRGATMERNVARAKEREAAEAVVAKAKKRADRRASAERKDLEAMNKAVENSEATRAARVARINKAARQRTIRRNERRAGYMEVVR